MVKQTISVAHPELVGGSTTTLHTHAGGGIPAGVIGMWSGLRANIPSGWALCDGSNGTPDLRGKFIQEVEGAEEAGETGGTLAKSHSGTTVGDHTNINVPGTATAALKVGTSASNAAAQTHTHTIASITHSVTQPSNHTDIRPPYYKLCFIMKL